MVGFKQVSEQEFKSKALGNQPFRRTIEYGNSVINIMRNGRVIGKIVEIRVRPAGVRNIQYNSKPQIKKEYYLPK